MIIQNFLLLCPDRVFGDLQDLMPSTCPPLNSHHWKLHLPKVCTRLCTWDLFIRVCCTGQWYSKIERSEPCAGIRVSHSPSSAITKMLKQQWSQRPLLQLSSFAQMRKVKKELMWGKDHPRNHRLFRMPWYITVRYPAVCLAVVPGF